MKIYMISGEASGDLLGASLLNKLYKEKIIIKGIGGPLMEKEGMQSLFPQSDLSIMGIIEVLKHIPKLHKRIKETIKDIIKFQADILLTIDSPGFNKQIIQKIKKINPSIKCIHYVAPSVYAWRESRAKKWAKLIDHMLCLFPFEPNYFIKEGLKATYVGHPISHWDLPNIPKKKQLLILPGSRKQEIKKIAPIFYQAAQLFIKQNPDFKIVWFIPLHLKKYLKSLLPNITVEHQNKEKIFAESSHAISKSGTVTLELSKANIAFIVGYKTSSTTAFLIKKMIKIPYVCLLNILYKQYMVKECLQENCTPQNLYQGLLEAKPIPFPQELKIDTNEKIFNTLKKYF